MIVEEAAAPVPGSRPSIAVLPGATPVASPLEPAAFDTSALAGSDDVQVTVAVRSCCVPSV